MIVVWFALALCSYRHVVADLMFQWQTNSSYSHGPIVIPIALWLLWHRRSTFPGVSTCWIGGIGLLATAHVLLCLGEYVYVPAVQRWTIPIWLSGMIGALWGRRLLAWSLPAVCFLGFMIPIPFQMEMLASQVLQWTSAWCSCFLLSLTSTFAATDGYTLRMLTGSVGITADCSGLRMTVAITAMCYGMTFISYGRTIGEHRADVANAVRPPRNVPESLPGTVLYLTAMMLLVIPAAIMANAARITAVALVMNHYRLESWTEWAHDLGDWIVLPVAAALFLAFRAWLGQVIHIWQVNSDQRRERRHGAHTRGRWLFRNMPAVRVAVAPVVLVALIGASIRHYHTERKQLAGEIMTAALGHEAVGDWENAATCYRQLMSLQVSADEASYRHACVSGQAAISRAELRQVLLQLEALLNRAPRHVAALRMHLDLALQLDLAVATRSARQLYEIEPDEAKTLQMCVEAILRFPAESAGLPVFTADSLEELVEKLGPVSQWRDNLVVQLAAFCCQHPDTVDTRLISTVGSAITKSAVNVGSAHAHYQAWHFQRVFSKGTASIELAMIPIDDHCPKHVAFEIYLARAAEATRDENTDEAKTLLQKAVALNPRDYRGYELLGEVYAVEQDWSRSSAALLRAWRLADDRTLNLGIQLAEALIRSERNPPLAPLVRLLAGEVNYGIPTPPKALQLRLRFVQAQLDMRANRHEDALQKLKHCLVLASSNPDQSETHALEPTILKRQAQCLVYLGRYSATAEFFEEQAATAGSSADAWVAAARAWRTAKKSSDAARCYHNAISRLGCYSEVWLEYVELLKETSGIAEAEGEVVFRHRRTQQDSPIEDTILAQAWEIVGQPDRAIPHYRSAAESDAGSVATLAIALARQGETEEAVRLVADNSWAVRMAIRAHTAAMVGVSANDLSQPNSEAITQIVNDGVTANHDDVTLMLAAAEWHTKCKSPSVAIDLLDHAVKVQPANVVAANNLAMLLADERRDFDQALGHIENVLKQAGPAPEFLDTKGWILVQMNRAQEALPWLTRAAERSSLTDSVAQLHLAAAYMAIGDRERAEEHFESARAGRIRPELLNTSEQRAWTTLQQEFMPQVLTQTESGQ